MWPTYIGPIVLSVALGLLFVSKLKNPYSTMFDLSVVFFLVASWSAISTVFYSYVISDKQTAQVLTDVRSLLEVDPTSKAKEMLRCSNDISKADVEKKVREIRASNTKNLWEGSLGIFVYTAAGIAMASLVLHIIKNVKDDKIFFRPVEMAILLMVLLSAAIPLGLFFLVVNRYSTFSKSDLGIRVLTDIKQVLSKGIIGFWNSDESLRDGIDKSPDAGMLASDIKAQLHDQMQELKLMVPSLDVLQKEVKSEITAALDALSTSVKGIADSLEKASKLPCDRSIENQPDGLHPAAEVLPALPEMARQLQDLSVLALDTGRSDIDVLLQNNLTGFQPLLTDLNRFATNNHCNQRERIRQTLREIQDACKSDAVAKTSFFTSFVPNVNGLIIGLIGVVALSLYLQKSVSKKLFWHASSVSVTVILLLTFCFMAMDFARTGEYRTLVDVDDFNHFMYMLLSGSTSPHDISDIAPKSSRCL